MVGAQTTSAATAAPPARLRRWWLPRVRFSLRSLLLLVLLIGSGATLWWNWAPWQPKFVFNEGAIVRRAGITPDGKFSFSLVDLSENPDATAIRIRELASGRLVRTLPVTGRIDTFKFSPNGKYAASIVNLRRAPGPSHLLWRTDTWEMLRSPKSGLVNFSAWGNLIQINRQDGGPLIVERLPSLERIELPEPGNMSISKDEKWLAVSHDATLNFYQIGSRERGKSITFDYFIYWHNCVGGRLVVILQANRPNGNPAAGRAQFLTRILSYPDLVPVAEIPGSVSKFSADGNFGMVTGDVSDEFAFWQISADPKRLWSAKASLNVSVTPDGQRVIGTDPQGSVCAWDGKTGTLLWSTKDGERACWIDLYSTKAKVFATSAAGERVVDGATGETLSEIPSWRYPRQVPGGWRVAEGVNDGQSEFMTYEVTRRKYNRTERTEGCGQQTILWHLRRPPGRFTFVYLWEFWLTAVLACAFVLSIWRDRRLGRAAQI